MARLLDPAAMVRTHALNRDERALRAHDTVNKVIPEMLRTSPRARHGIHQSVLVADPDLESGEKPLQTSHNNKGRIRIRVKETDTFTAARQMTYSSRRASVTATTPREQPSRRVPNVCVLNQASSIKPGGGFLDGVHSQEEFLCQRSTLFASLWDSMYPLPEIGGIFSSDVLVFADSTPEAEELPKRDRIYVDAISASTIKFPGAPRFKQAESDEPRRPHCSCGVSYCDQDRDVVTAKMRAVLRIADTKGVEKLVLGAWGCGAYGNPPQEVAKLWKKAICGTARSPAAWPHINEIVFAIPDRPALREFEKCFADVIAANPISSPPVERIAPIVEEESDKVQDLISEIQETETQLSQLLNPRTKGRLRDKLTTLNKRLAELGTDHPVDDPDDDNLDEDFVVQDYPASDNDEGGSYYAFDENDDPSSSGSVTPASSYEFRFEPPSPAKSRKSAKGTVSPSPATELGFVHAIDDPDGIPTPTMARDGPGVLRAADERRRVDDAGGWFAGSVGELSALLRKTGPPVGLNPALSPVEVRHGEGFPEF